MASFSDNYNPRIIIVDHFDDIKNELDIKVATLFDQNRQLNKKEMDEINEIWVKQISQIEKTRESNLSMWPENFDKQRYELEWTELNGTSLPEEKKIEKIKKSIIKSDAILMHDRSLITQTCLCEMPFYVNEPNLDLAK